MTKTIIFLRELFKRTSGISLHSVPYKNSDFLSFLQDCTDHIFDTVFDQDNMLQKQLMQISMQENAIYTYSTLDVITFIMYMDKEQDLLLFLGPVLTKPFSKEDALKALIKYTLTPQITDRILQYCAALPVLERQTLYGICELVVGYLADTQQTAKNDKNIPLSPAENFLVSSSYTAGEDIIQMRQIEIRYEHSIALTDAIKQGNLSLALHLIGQHTPDSQNPVRNKNPLRNAQNYCIVLNTQLRHAMEETGVHPYRVDKLSNQIGLEIEQLTSLSQLNDFFKNVIRRYCRLVQEYDYPNLKPLVNLTITYIKEHLSDNLTVKDTAKALTVNANYLSTLFHKELGITFIDFVNKERIRQALGLLVHTNLQIQQIASLVGYNNTSYFTKQFLRFQGITPSQYRHN